MGKIVSEQNLGSYVTLHPTSHTTNTFTPTTLKTIEQMFVEVEEPESYKNQAGFAPPTLKRKTYINMDSSNWQQGGVTTVVSQQRTSSGRSALVMQELGSPSTGAHLVS